MGQKIWTGLAGNGISESRSPFLHAYFGQELGLDVECALLDPQGEGFGRALEMAAGLGIEKLNVTAPFKGDAFAAAGSAGPAARMTEGANCLSLGPGGWEAESFDAAGFLTDLEANAGFDARGKAALILGAGQAARSAAQALSMAGASEIMVCARDAAKAAPFAEKWGARVLEWSQGAGCASVDLAVNASSSGKRGETMALPPGMPRAALAYDLNVGEGGTFWDWAARRAKVRRDGSGMLCEQAALAFKWWFGKKPPTRGALELFGARSG